MSPLPVCRRYPSPAGVSFATRTPSRTGQSAASFSSRWTTSAPVKYASGACSPQHVVRKARRVEAKRVPALGAPALADPAPLQDLMLDAAVGERDARRKPGRARARHHTVDHGALPGSALTRRSNLRPRTIMHGNRTASATRCARPAQGCSGASSGITRRPIATNRPTIVMPDASA